MLPGVGVFVEDADARFGLTPLGAALRSDVTDSVRDRALFYGAPEMWPVWGDLLEAGTTGRSAFEQPT